MKHTCKKLFSVLLVLAMVISLMPSLVLPASAAGAVISVGGQTAAAGTEVTVPVILTGNPGFASFVLTPSYDTANLTLTSVEKGSALTSTTGSFLFGTNIVYGDSVNTTGDGVILNLKFTVSASAAAGNYPVSLTLTNGDLENFCNDTPVAVPVTFVAGGIMVAASDTTAPIMTKLTATVGGTDRESTDGALALSVGDTVSAIKVTMSEPVSLAPGGSTNVTIAGGSIPAGTLYGVLSLDPGDPSNQTLLITPNPGNETSALEGVFTFSVAADTVKDAAGNGNALTAFTLTVAASDTTAPAMTKLTATVSGTDRESTDGTLALSVGDTVSAIKVTMSEPVSLAPGGSTNVTIAGGSIPAGTLYGVLSLDPGDPSNQTLLITPNLGE